MKTTKLISLIAILNSCLLFSACQHKSTSSAPTAQQSQQNTESHQQKIAAEKHKYTFYGKLSKKDLEQLKNMKVAAFGDSIMAGCSDDYKKMFPKITIDAGVSRQAADLMSELQGKELPQTIIIGLGTNGPFTQEQYDQIMHTLGKRQVYWINTNVDREWRDDVNDLLIQGTQKYTNAHVISWYKYSQGHDDWFWDGIHPNITGRQKMVEFVARNILADQKY